MCSTKALKCLYLESYVMCFQRTRADLTHNSTVAFNSHL